MYYELGIAHAINYNDSKKKLGIPELLFLRVIRFVFSKESLVLY